jgi:spiro-SPASM protein
MNVQIILYDDAPAASLAWARAFSAAPFQVDGTAAAFLPPLVVSGPLTAQQLAARLAAAAKESGADAVLFGLATCPFYNRALTAEVLDTHLRYRAEYTFAEGYCGGLAPIAVDSGALALIAELCAHDPHPLPVTGDCLFALLQRDINSFEVETVIAPKDYRAWRINFDTATKRGRMACDALAAALAARAVRANNYSPLPEIRAVLSPPVICDSACNTPAVMRTVPAFYNVQISGAMPTAPLYAPHNEFAIDETVRALHATPPPAFMDLAIFRRIVSPAASLSGDATLGLSCWGEPLAHPQFLEFVAAAASHPGLSLLVETWGHLVTPELVEKTKTAAAGAPLTWIVYVDAMDEETYEKIHYPIATPAVRALHATPRQAAAQNALELLNAAFPGAVYPQFTRMHENEHQLEAFYRHYKEKGNVIIQKYDWFCGALPQRKPADLSPLERELCWHHLRDMVILLDGTVPLCRECSWGKRIKPVYGNVATEALDAIWEKRKSMPYIDIDPLCKDCDEYYTFNF